MKRVLFIILFISSFNNNAQTDSLKPLTITGFVETYFSYDSRKPDDHKKPSFIYSHNRSNELNVNLAYIKAAYEKKNIRANLALMAGTYSNANLANEPGVLKNIYEANTGLKISKKKDLWVDAGIFSSHIGFESAHAPSCWNLTRSLLADNSPYFETGAKISLTSINKKWFLSGLVLNGWQRIQMQDGNSAPAFGHQVTFKPNDKFTLNSSSFVGSDTPDSIRSMRYFHNFYAQWQIRKKIGLIFGFDIGIQQQFKHSSSYNTWYSPVLIAKFKTSEKSNLSLRGEYYSDPNQVIIFTGSTNGFQTSGYSVNFDYYFSENALWRIESRLLNSMDNIFIHESEDFNYFYFLTTSLAVTF